MDNRAQNSKVFRTAFNLSLLLYCACFFIAIDSAPAAAESICPCGGSPRSDVVLCLYFDQLQSCSNGREPTCFNDNGIGDALNTLDGFRIKETQAAVGSGYIAGKGRYGTTGPGYLSARIPGGPYAAVNIRYYMRFSGGYATYIYDHGPSVKGSSQIAGNSCVRGGTFEQSQFAYYAYNTGGGCRSGSFNLFPNKGNSPILRNNRWYLIEQQKVIDTSCSASSSPTDCNGVYRLWIDGVLVSEHTNVNWGGVSDGVMWDEFWGPRSYYHVRSPAWEPEIHFDNFVISKTGATIGPAAGENPRGDADPLSPYVNYQGIEPFLGRHPANDCTDPSGYLGTSYGRSWRSGGSLQTGITHGGFVDQCQSPPLQDKALMARVDASQGGAGIQYERWQDTVSPVVFPQQVIHGWVYLPGSNDYSQAPALVGFRGYSCAPGNCDGAEWGNYAALTVQDSHFAVVQRHIKSQVAPSVIPTSQGAIFNSWVEFEIIVWQNQKVSLSINRSQLLNKQSLPYPVAWLFTEGGDNGGVVGVIDFSGASPFTVYYDDVSLGTMSFTNCDGWHSSSCPFGEGGPSPDPDDHTAPSAPTGLTAIVTSD